MLCKKDAVLATYTSAKSVANALENTGFAVEKVAGFDGKREMIRAKFLGGENERSEFYFSRNTPEILPIKYSNFSDLRNTHRLYNPRNFYPMHTPKPRKPRAIVVGAGIAGLATA